MKKSKKITIGILMLLLTMCSMERHNLEAKETDEIQRKNNESNAMQQCELLMENLSEKEDYYGGVYINDNGNLVVCVTDKYNKKSNLLQTYTKSNNIIIQDVTYSHDMLLNVYEQISTMYPNLYQIYKNDTSDEFEMLASISGTYVDTKKNRVVVEMNELNENKILLFKELFTDEECVEFEEGVYITFASEETNTVSPLDDSVFDPSGSGKP